MKLLAIDTASARCSAALWMDGELLCRAVPTPREHAQLILPMVEALLGEAGSALRQLDGIAFGRGPGSFTGLRVAAAVTQGLAAGADLPVLPISDLRALAAQARAAQGVMPPLPGQLLLACMDARMGEIYWGAFEPGPAVPPAAGFDETVGAPDTLPAVLRGRVALAAGRGLGTYPAIARSLDIGMSCCLGEAEPDAADIARLAAADLAAGASWLDASAAQPVYLRDQVAKMPS